MTIRKNILCAALAGACLLFCLAMPARAFDTQTQEPEKRTVLKQLGGLYQPVANAFGCGEFAQAEFLQDGNMVALQYVPKGQDPAAWTRITHVSVYALTGDPAQDKDMMRGLAGALMESLDTSQGTVRAREHQLTPEDEPAIFIDYEIGAGAEKEHNAGIFMRATPVTAAFIQVQSRGDDLTEADIRNLKQLLPAQQ